MLLLTRLIPLLLALWPSAPLPEDERRFGEVTGEEAFGEPRLEVRKAARELLFVAPDGRAWRFPIALGFQPHGTKTREGDGATPEGRYRVCVKNPTSAFHLSLGIDYPDPADAARGREAGLLTDEERDAIEQAHARGATPPWKTALGGEIFIHGGGGGGQDWTAGCVALDDAAMEIIYPLVPIGLPVIIFP